MLEKIRMLKRHVLELEEALKECKQEDFSKHASDIKSILNQLEGEFNTSLKVFGELFDTDNIQIELAEPSPDQLEFKDFDIDLDVEYNPSTGTVLQTNRKFSSTIINELKFLYKPVERINVFEGNYLERFADERTDQLMKSRSINQHNEFWKLHQTVRGNVYGSVPAELLSQDSLDTLRRFGWKDVEVRIHDFGVLNVDVDELIHHIEEKFEHYILLFEEETSTHLVLEYEI
ncbi:MAG: hypothetical protein JXO44_08455 [Clostridia bacterium]|nr:hypothetical protein [Clostridia bacterium]